MEYTSAPEVIESTEEITNDQEVIETTDELTAIDESLAKLAEELQVGEDSEVSDEVSEVE